MGEPCLIEPDKFDVVVVGTGLVESLVAASAAFCGVRVLQIDAESHYGGTSSTLSCNELAPYFQGACHVFEAMDKFSSVAEPDLLDRALFDVSPKVLYGDGPLIFLLLRTGAHNYTEFKLVDGRLMWQDSASSFVPIAASRAEIFRDTSMTLKQKHVLMKALKGVLGEEEDVDLEAGLLSKYGCDDIDLVDRFVHGVLLQHDASELNTSKARDLVELYGRSGGKYGPGTSPLLYPIHGTAELPQAFCRTAAVHGATQCLRCRIVDVQFDGGEYHLELGNGQVIHAPFVATSRASLMHLALGEEDLERETILRCYALVSGRLFEEHHQCLAAIPRGSSQGRTVWMLQLDDSTYHCPPGWSCLHAWTVHKGASGGDCVEGLKRSLRKHLDCSAIFEEEGSVAGGGRPKVAFACFASSQTPSLEDNECVHPNIAVCRDHPGDVSLIRTKDEVIRCFRVVCPGREFPFDDASKSKMDDQADDEESVLSSLESALAE